MTVHHALTRPRPLKLTVDDYLLLDRSGALDGRGKTELLDGRIHAMNAQHRPHARAKSLLFVCLVDALAAAGRADLTALVEGSVAFLAHNAPQPDLLVTSEADGEGLVPGPSVPLVIEVSDSTVRFDLGKKARIYATAGVPEYWVVDLPGRTVHQHWSPAPKGYGQKREVSLGAPVTAVAIDGLTVPTDGI